MIGSPNSESTVDPNRYSGPVARRLGEEWYEKSIRSLVDPAKLGQVVAIDFETGDWEVSPESLDAVDRLKAGRPGAYIWCLRVGYRAMLKIGGVRL